MSMVKMWTGQIVFAVAIAAILSGAHAESPLRLRNSERSDSNSESNRRKLDSTLIAGYMPVSDVTDAARIDLDQIMFEQQLSGLTLDDFTNAQKMYQLGGYTGTVSRITLKKPLPIDLYKNTKVFGKSHDVKTVLTLTAYEDYKKGALMISLIYQGLNCFIGGLLFPTINGCLASNATVSLEGAFNATTVDYFYDVEKDTFNYRTLASLSTTANSAMRNPDTDSYWYDFQKFVNYYGTETYADQFIISAITGDGTVFKNGNAEFNRYEYTPRAEAAMKGTLLLSIWMSVVRNLEYAVWECEFGCYNETCIDRSLASLDEAVAYYAGSSQGTDGTGQGVLLYDLANARGESFKTMGPQGNELTGVAKVNIDIFRQLKSMQRYLVDKDCISARAVKEIVSYKMTVPLIQGLLRSAYIGNTRRDAPIREEAEGATYAAALLPLVAHCSMEDAKVIYQNMKTGRGINCDFVKVKHALEKNYPCMGIHPADVGGLWDDVSNNYYPGAEPLAGAMGPNVGLAVGLSIGGLFSVLLIWLLCISDNGGIDDRGDIDFKDTSEGEEHNDAIHEAAVANGIALRDDDEHDEIDLNDDDDYHRDDASKTKPEIS